MGEGQEPQPSDEEVLTDPFEVIRHERARGRPDEAIAAYLNTGAWPLPPGAARWTGYTVRAFLGEGGGLA